MLWFLRQLGSVLGKLAFLVGIRSHVTLDNLSQAFPDWNGSKRREVAMGSYAMLGSIFFEFLYLRFASRTAVKSGLEIVNLSECLPILTSPNGAILLSGHLGNWEWLALGCGLRANKPLDVIVKNQTGQFSEKFLIRMRSRFGNRMIVAGNVLGIYRAAKKGELIAILGDQTGTPEDVRVRFFGREVPTFEGTARLALSTRLPILFLEPFERTSNGYCCRFHPVPFEDLTEMNLETVRELTRRHTALLESVICEHPTFWLWQHRRWKHVMNASTK